MAAKKQLTAAQGMDAARILFELNSKREHIVNLAFGAEIPEACLTEPGALPDFCAEWRAFVHATVSPVSQSNPSMCTSALFARNVSKSKAITSSVPAKSSAIPS